MDYYQIYSENHANLNKSIWYRFKRQFVKLKAMGDKMLQGSAVIEKAMIQEKELREKKQILAQRRELEARNCLVNFSPEKDSNFMENQKILSDI